MRTASGSFNEIYSFTQPIRVNDPGDYKLSFYNMFNCIYSTCNTANDTMSFRIKEGISGVYKEVYLSGTNYGRLKDDRWVKQEVNLKLNKTDYYVIFHT